MTQQRNSIDRTQNIILELNKSGLSYLTHMHFPQAFEYFKQCQKIISKELKDDPNSLRTNKLAGITYNNLACYYKKTNKPKISLIYLQKALQIEVNKVQDWSATASTHLNICAIYSFLKNHESAANHAELAIEMLSKLDPNQCICQRKSNSSTEKLYTEQQQKSIINLKILAHYNLAVQLEYLKRYEEAVEEFTKAKDLAKQRGKKHVGIIMVCDQSITRLKQLLDQLKDRLIRLIAKRKDNYQKGFHKFIKLNKKNIPFKSTLPQRVNTGLANKLRELRIYQEKPYYRTKTIFRLKTSSKANQTNKSEMKNPRNTSFSNL